MSHEFLQFINASTDLAKAIPGTCDFWLVALSVLVASLAAYAALLIVERLCESHIPLDFSLGLSIEDVFALSSQEVACNALGDFCRHPVLRLMGAGAEVGCEDHFIRG